PASRPAFFNPVLLSSVVRLPNPFATSWFCTQWQIEFSFPAPPGSCLRAAVSCELPEHFEMKSELETLGALDPHPAKAITVAGTASRLAAERNPRFLIAHLRARRRCSPTERGGFEPPNEVNPRYAISSRARSTAPAPLQVAT